MEKKQVIILRKDLNMRKGKMVAQGAHASMAALLLLAKKDNNKLILSLDDINLDGWLNDKFKKITLGVNSLDEMDKIYQEALKNNIVCSYIIDSGLTEFNGIPTPTAICLGPDFSDKIDIITGKLSLL